MCMIAMAAVCLRCTVYFADTCCFLGQDRDTIRKLRHDCIVFRSKCTCRYICVCLYVTAFILCVSFACAVDCFMDIVLYMIEYTTKV